MTRVQHLPPDVAAEQAAPLAHLPLHYHPHPVILEVLRGRATVIMDGVTRHLTAGQQFHIPAERFHRVVFGETGCTYATRRTTHRPLKRGGYHV